MAMSDVTSSPLWCHLVISDFEIGFFTDLVYLAQKMNSELGALQVTALWKKKHHWEHIFCIECLIEKYKYVTLSPSTRVEVLVSGYTYQFLQVEVDALDKMFKKCNRLLNLRTLRTRVMVIQIDWQNAKRLKNVFAKCKTACGDQRRWTKPLRLSSHNIWILWV